MKNTLPNTVLTILLGFAMVSSCKKDKTCENCLLVNKPPIANAGNDTTIVLPANIAYLNGSKSYDPDNTVKNYTWTNISGLSPVNISNPTSIISEVSNLLEGNYFFELKVIDADGLFSKDTMQITVISIKNEICDNTNRPIIPARLLPIGNLSEAKSGMSVATAGNKILFAGAGLNANAQSGLPAGTLNYGSSRVDIYDVVTQAWSVAELSKSRSDIASVSVGNKIFFAGGRLGDGAFDQLFSTVDIYDVSSNTWSVANLSEPRAYIAAAVVGNKVLFAGGEKDWDYNTSATVDIYDISSNNWSTTLLSEKRAFISAVTVDNKIYFAGGHSEDRWYQLPSKKIDIYDNNTNTWSTSSLMMPMGIPDGLHISGKIYWSEGCAVEIKNVITGNSSMTHLSKPRSWIGVGQNAVVKDNTIIFFNGFSEGNRFDMYNINSGIWSIGELPVNISSASIISVNNIIYVAGGFINNVISNQVWKLEF